jgi:uncharacterized membrane protein YeaQ/YmgE (transglycosylase-associated protein family)
MHIIWTVIIGFVAGVIAKLITPGPNNPSGFILTTLLGIVGASCQLLSDTGSAGYGPGEGAGFIGAIVGAVIMLAVWHLVARPTRI